MVPDIKKGAQAAGMEVPIAEFFDVQTADFSPLYSFHSRVDGENHGIVAAAELNGALYVLAKGPKRLLRLTISEAKEALAA